MPATPTSQTLLVIDDSQDVHDLIDVRLRSEPLTILHALDGAEGIRMAQKARPDVILLDLNLPGATGLEVCRTLKADDTLAAVPIIFLTGATDVDIKGRAFDLGACDYVTKPFEPVELRARVRSALRIKRLMDLLANKAQIDDLTGLWNRSYFHRHLGERLAAAEELRRPLSLLLCDIDRFKALNDSHGRPFGDLVMGQVAETIESLQVSPDGVCRLEGDMFGILLPDVPADEALAIGQHIRQLVESLAFQAFRTSVTVTVSVGAATREPLGRLSATELYRFAERALDAARVGGGNHVANTSWSQRP